MQVINICGGSQIWVESMLSNLAHTPFLLNDVYLASVEGFHQGIKYQDLLRRQKIFELWGVKAKSAGREANRCADGYVYWGSPLQPIQWQSKAYFDLYFDALLMKFTQNPEAKMALAASGSSRFSHVLPNGQGLSVAEFQETHLCQTLYCLRDLINGGGEDIESCKEKLSEKFRLYCNYSAP